MLLVAVSAVGQQNDFHNWFGLDLSYKMNKQWSSAAFAQVRTFQNAAYWRTSFVGGELGYRPVKWYKITAGYRYNWRRFSNSQRFQLDNSFKKSWNKKHQLQLRVRAQITVLQAEIVNQTRLRPRLKYTYKITKKWRVYALTEAFYTQDWFTLAFDQMRYGIGSQFKVRKKHTLQLQYLVNMEYNRPRRQNNFVLGVKYKIALN
jgi:hypothetical protein